MYTVPDRVTADLLFKGFAQIAIGPLNSDTNHVVSLGATNLREFRDVVFRQRVADGRLGTYPRQTPTKHPQKPMQRLGKT